MRTNGQNTEVKFTNEQENFIVKTIIEAINNKEITTLPMMRLMLGDMLEAGLFSYVDMYEILNYNYPEFILDLHLGEAKNSMREVFEFALFNRSYTSESLLREILEAYIGAYRFDIEELLVIFENLYPQYINTFISINKYLGTINEEFLIGE